MSNRGSSEPSVQPISLVHSSKGFTLVELLVVLALVGILTAVAVPSIINMRNSLNYRGATRDVLSIMRNARSLAISENREHMVDIDTANRRYRLLKGNRVSGSDSFSPVKDYISLPSSVTIVTSDPTSFTFKPDGSATVSPDNDSDSFSDETISIRDSSGTTKYTITISPRMGRIKAS